MNDVPARAADDTIDLDEPIVHPHLPLGSAERARLIHNMYGVRIPAGNAEGCGRGILGLATELDVENVDGPRHGERGVRGDRRLRVEIERIRPLRDEEVGLGGR